MYRLTLHLRGTIKVNNLPTTGLQITYAYIHTYFIVVGQCLLRVLVHIDEFYYQMKMCVNMEFWYIAIILKGECLLIIWVWEARNLTKQVQDSWTLSWQQGQHKPVL